MSLKVVNKDLSVFHCCGAERSTASVAGITCFGKRFALTQNSSSGVSFTRSRTNSPNQHASLGNIGTGNTIYYGDTVTIGISANSGYINAKLYVDIGDGRGLVQRTAPYTFTVNGNVTYYGNATLQENWQTAWEGSQAFTSSDSFTVPGLASGGKVQISAKIEFKEYVYDPYGDESFLNNLITENLNNRTLPVTVHRGGASVSFTCSGSTINFTFTPYEEDYKGYVMYTEPDKITITQVRSTT